MWVGFEFGHEDVRILDHGLHVVAVRDELRRGVALVERHAFGVLDLGLETLGFVNRDRAVAPPRCPWPER